MKQLSISCILFLFFSSLLFAEPNIELLEFAGIGNLEGVKKSLSENANINYQDTVGTSALMFAANNNHFSVVKYLVDNKVNVLAKNTNGWTAAVLAGVRGNTIIKEYLEGIEKTLFKSRATGIVLAVHGEAYVDNKKLKVGDRVLENQTVFVAKKSVCELQIRQSLSQVVLRLKQDTVFTLKYKEEPRTEVFSGLVKKGSVVFKIKKLFTGEKVQAISPTMVASVRGTIFEVIVDKLGGTKIFVYEGFVRVRARDPEIEDDESIEDTMEVKKFVSDLDYNSQNISAGNSIELTDSKHKEIMKKADADGVLKKAKRMEYSTFPTAPLSLRCSEKPDLQIMEPSQLESGEKESEDLVGVDSADLKNSFDEENTDRLIENRKEAKMIADFQPDVLKSPETILLKDGSRVYGSIYEIGKKYVVFSNVGKQVFDAADIDGYIFE